MEEQKSGFRVTIEAVKELKEGYLKLDVSRLEQAVVAHMQVLRCSFGGAVLRSSRNCLAGMWLH